MNVIKLSMLLSLWFLAAELARTRQEAKTAVERAEHQMELQKQKMLQTEKDLQVALQQEKIAHEEDVEKLVAERVKILTRKIASESVGFCC